MIPFRRPELSDREALCDLFLASEYRGCEYSFVNIYIWGQQQFALVEGELVLFSHWDGRSMYVYPGSSSRGAVIEALEADAAERGIPMRLYGLDRAAVEEIEALFPGKYGFSANRDGFDYLYEIERLAELRGKKLQQKRNHINRFVDLYPDWYVRPITAENLDDCREMAADWYRVHEDPENDYRLEKVAMCRAFHNFDALGMEGLALYADGRIVAMTMGNRLRRDTFDVNFEKAYADIPGAYPLINREFARMIREHWPEVRYLNREEDMGIPGLRKSKLSYHPDVLLEKYRGFHRPEVTL